jgi:glycosyltransferase XagB
MLRVNSSIQPLSPSDRALGDLLIVRRVLTLPQLDEAVGLAERWQVRLGDAILSRNWTDPAIYYQAVAFHYQLSFVDLIKDAPDPALLHAAEADVYARRLTIPWRRSGEKIIVATSEPGPEIVLFARERWGDDVELVVASKFDIVWAVQTAFAESLSHRAIFELAERTPEMSAQKVFTAAQLAFVYGVFTAFMFGLAYAPIMTLIAINAALSILYLGNFVFKGVLVSVGGGRSTEKDEAIAVEARLLQEEDLPVFTVLVPMFREGESLPNLAQSLRQLDYPLGKLDIKLVLEADDHETIEVARTQGLEGISKSSECRRRILKPSRRHVILRCSLREGLPRHLRCRGPS